LRVLRSPLEEEQRLFSSLSSEYYTASLVELKGAVRHSPYTTYMAQWVERPEHGVIVDMDTSGVHTPGIRTPEGVAAYDRLEGRQTKSCIQLGKEPASKARLEEILRQHYVDGFNASTMEVLALKTWNYMPRWSPEEGGEGRHWEVFHLQGVAGMWYAGSSVSFESVPAVMEYNELLLRQMDN